jgi:hypothetical protein
MDENNFKTILNNNETKIIFLKSILLGINYGNSKDSLKYQNSVENEIKEISKKINKKKVSFQKIPEVEPLDTAEKMHTGEPISSALAEDYKELQIIKENISDKKSGVFRKIQTRENPHPASPLPGFVEIPECCRGRRDVNIQALQESAVLTEKTIPESTDSKNIIFLNIEKYKNIISNLENKKNNIEQFIKNLVDSNHKYNYHKINFLKNNLNFINYEINKNKIIMIREINNQKLLNNLDTL